MTKENDRSNTLCKECNTQDTANNNACKFTEGPKVSLTVSSKKIRRGMSDVQKQILRAWQTGQRKGRKETDMVHKRRIRNSSVYRFNTKSGDSPHRAFAAKVTTISSSFQVKAKFNLQYQISKLNAPT